MQSNGPTALLAALAATLLIAGPATAQSYDQTGPYVRGGLAFGFTNLDGPANALDPGTNVGFNLAGGFRVSPAVALEAELFYVTGGDVELAGTKLGETSVVGFTIDVKGYPMAVLAKKSLPDNLQPYARFGIGGGSGELEGSGIAAGIKGSEGAFLARFGGGVDYLMNEHWGVFFDGSYYASNKDIVIGTGVISFGTIYRF